MSTWAPDDAMHWWHACRERPLFVYCLYIINTILDQRDPCTLITLPLELHYFTGFYTLHSHEPQLGSQSTQPY
jgi:hypothetical protein